MRESFQDLARQLALEAAKIDKMILDCLRADDGDESYDTTHMRARDMIRALRKTLS